MVEESNTHNADPSKSRLAGTCMSEKKSTLTGCGFPLAARLLSNGPLKQINIPRIPCSVQLEILPVMISPLKGRKTMRRNSANAPSVDHENSQVDSATRLPLTLTKPSLWPMSPSETFSRSYIQMHNPIFWTTWAVVNMIDHGDRMLWGCVLCSSISHWFCPRPHPGWPCRTHAVESAQDLRW